LGLCTVYWHGTRRDLDENKNTIFFKKTCMVAGMVHEPTRINIALNILILLTLMQFFDLVGDTPYTNCTKFKYKMRRIEAFSVPNGRCPQLCPQRGSIMTGKRLYCQHRSRQEGACLIAHLRHVTGSAKLRMKEKLTIYRKGR